MKITKQNSKSIQVNVVTGKEYHWKTLNVEKDEVKITDPTTKESKTKIVYTIFGLVTDPESSFKIHKKRKITRSYFITETVLDDGSTVYNSPFAYHELELGNLSVIDEYDILFNKTNNRSVWFEEFLNSTTNKPYLVPKFKKPEYDTTEVE